MPVVIVTQPSTQTRVAKASNECVTTIFVYTHYYLRNRLYSLTNKINQETVETRIIRMTEQGNEIDELLEKYSKSERELEKKMRECEQARQEIQSRGKSKINTDSSVSSRRYQREESHARNQQLLKDFEKAKAILRTESTFTPNEQELRDLASAYRHFLQS